MKNDVSAGIKFCPKCNAYLPIAYFHKNKSVKATGLQNYCIKHEYAARVASRAKKPGATHNRKDITRQAKDRPCTDCGIQYPYYVMHFDHVRGEKKFNIGAARDYNTEKLLAEIEKCEVVCANCHAERTYQRKQYNR